MTQDKLRSVFQFYLDYIQGRGIAPRKSEEFPTHRGHLAYMARTAITELIPNSKIEKAMRWLGYIQGCMVNSGDFNLEDVKRHSRPDDERAALEGKG